MIKIVIGENEAGQRVDRFLRKYLGGAPLSMVYRILRKDLKVNGRRVHEDAQLAPGDEITLYLTEEQLGKIARSPKKKPAARRQFRIAYEDDQVLIVNKPKGLLVHGDAREKSNTLANQVCGYLQEKGEYDPARERTFAPAPVNRIDRNTSGLVIFGKTAEALRQLTKLIRERDRIRKFYLAIAAGTIDDELVLTGALSKDKETNRVRIVEATEGQATAAAGQAERLVDIKPAVTPQAVTPQAVTSQAAATAGQAERLVDIKQAVISQAATSQAATPQAAATAASQQAAPQPAETRVRPLRAGRRVSLIEAELITGRTHQIRVHLAGAGHPLAGDPKYGDPKVNEDCRRYGVSSQLLHAYRLEFGELDQPLDKLSGKTVEAKPPKVFEQIEKELING